MGKIAGGLVLISVGVGFCLVVLVYEGLTSLGGNFLPIVCGEGDLELVNLDF